VTTPTNGQAGTGYTGEPLYLPHNTNIGVLLRALERVSRGSVARQAVTRAREKRGQAGSEYKGRGDGNSFKRQSVSGHNVT